LRKPMNEENGLAVAVAGLLDVKDESAATRD
jgi:hypothetical protein